jgi:hypothetical protein
MEGAVSQTGAIEERIARAEPGVLFVPSDFADLAGPDAVSQALSRMARKGELTRAVRGVYAKPRVSALLGEEVPPSPDEVAHAIARSNRWVIAPAGDTALNQLGLDTQVPAVHEYVSSGPYKSCRYGRSRIEMRHRANRDLLECSPLTCLITQALKALGKNAADEGLARRIAGRLTDDEVETYLRETQGSTAWVHEFAKRMREAKGC